MSRSQQIVYRVLSLDRDVHRRELFFAQAQADRFEVFRAIDKDDPCIDERFDFQKARDLIGREPSRGEVGCTLSHLEIYRSFLAQSTAQWLVVCEDDVVFHERFDLLEGILAQAYPEFEIYIFSAFKGQTFSASHPHDLKYPMQFFPRHYAGVRIGRVSKNYMCMTAGYAIHRRMAERIVSFCDQHKVYWLADDFSTLMRVAGYAHNVLAHIKPRLVMENSTLQSNLQADRLKFFAKKSMLRKRLSVLFFYFKNGLLYPFKASYACFKRSLDASR